MSKEQISLIILYLVLGTVFGMCCGLFFGIIGKEVDGLDKDFFQGNHIPGQKENIKNKQCKNL